jgi:hypothetical protein
MSVMRLSSQATTTTFDQKKTHTNTHIVHHRWNPRDKKKKNKAFKPPSYSFVETYEENHFSNTIQDKNHCLHSEMLRNSEWQC